MPLTASPSAAASFDAAVAGGGVAGLAAALALAKSGLRVALVVRGGAPAPDLRTAALFPASVRFLEAIGAWQGCAAEAAPLRAIRILDDTSWLLKAPETVFTAAEVGEAELASNIANAALVRALSAALEECPSLIKLTIAGTPHYQPASGCVVLTLPDGAAFTTKLLVAADGRDSPAREAAGIGCKRRKLDQTALVATFAHARPHQDVSTELHRDAGPLTTVPLPGNRSSLVWVERPREAERLAKLDGPGFLAELQSRLHGLLGELSMPGPRMAFPLQWLEAETFARARTALIGEAAHVLPPIGAQGLNLGLRDAGEITRLALAALQSGRDPGAEDVLAAYDAARRADTRSRSFTVDILNRSLESGALPLQLARGLGLFAMNLSPAFKRAVMWHGAGGLGLPPTPGGAARLIPPPARRAAG